MKILVINCGSSSLKYQLIDSDTEAVLAKGLCERIGIDGSNIAHQPAGGEKVKEMADMPDHTAAVKLVETLGGKVIKCVFLMELAGLEGRKALAGHDVESVICYEGK